MSTLLALNAPVPTSTLSFEHLFDGDDAELVRLSRLRRSFAESATVPDVDATFAYRNAWISFWRRNIRFVGSSARSREPLRFEWHVQLFSNDSHSIEYTDPSPLLETACITFAAVAAHQRLAGEATNLADAESHAQHALTLLAWLREHAISVARRISEPPPSRDAHLSLEAAMRLEISSNYVRLRAPELLSPYLVTAVERAISAQLHCKRAINALSAASGMTLMAASQFFAGARLFDRASRTLPAETTLATAYRRVTALGYRYLAQALVDEGTPAHHGVAIALAREAVALDTTSTSLSRFNDEMRERNRIEFGMQSVPSNGAIVLDFTRESTLRVAQDPLTSHYTISVPLP